MPTTQRSPLTIIVAMTPYGVIGHNGGIPWKCPQDMQRFKALTTSHTIIMGRKTYESIGRPLPNRTNVVLTGATSNKLDLSKVEPSDPRIRTRIEGVPMDGLYVCHTLADALTLARSNSDPEPFVIGGAAVYKEALELATKLQITYVLRNGIPGDTFFPPFPPGTHYPDVMTWRCTARIAAAGTDDIEFHTFERRPS